MYRGSTRDRQQQRRSKKHKERRNPQDQRKHTCSYQAPEHQTWTQTYKHWQHVTQPKWDPADIFNQETCHILGWNEATAIDGARLEAHTIRNEAPIPRHRTHSWEIQTWSRASSINSTWSPPLRLPRRGDAGLTASHAIACQAPRRAPHRARHGAVGGCPNRAP